MCRYPKQLRSSGKRPHYKYLGSHPEGVRQCSELATSLEQKAMKNITYPKLEIKSLLIAIVFSGIADASFGQFQFSSSSAYRYSTAFDYGNEYFFDAYRDADGVVYALGQSDGPLQDDYSSTNNKIFINKFTSNGTLLWQKVIKDA